MILYRLMLIANLKQPELLFALFAIMRAMSEYGAVLLNVSSTALLMQSKSYTNATMFVSIIDQYNYIKRILLYS